MNKRLLWTTALLTTALGIRYAVKPNQSRQLTLLGLTHTGNFPRIVPPAQPIDVVKVGEYQSQTKTKATVIARIQPHELAGVR